MESEPFLPPSSPIPPPPQDPEDDPSLAPYDQEDQDPDFDDPEPQPNVPDHTGVNTLLTATLAELKLAQDLVDAIRNAVLEDDIDEEHLKTIKNPENTQFNIDPSLLISLQLYNAMTDCSEKAYERVQKFWNTHNPSTKVISYWRVKKKLAELTRVFVTKTDMCPNSCYAYTGPWANLDECPSCATSRWDPFKSMADHKVPARQFYSILLGSLLQAFYQSPAIARLMRHGYDCTQKILEMTSNEETPCPMVFDDVYHGASYLEAARAGKIGPWDPILMFTLDGAQLYQNKQSDCWFFFWVLLNLPPELRYKKQFVLPAGFVPGPNKPENIPSFALPSWRHCSALQKQGLPIWDGNRKVIATSWPFFYCCGSDAVASPISSGQVSHGGKKGCRENCNMPGRRKPGASMYYPALLRPLNYDVAGCSHPDIDPKTLEPPNHVRYLEKLHLVLSSRTNNEFERNRLETGIVRPSPFLGLSPEHSIPVPECFPSDLMHLTINLAELLIPLWRGEIRPDGATIAQCEHAFLVGDAWQEHGRLVEMTRPYLPGSFNRAPRNPAQKINSGFKAWEYMLYLWSIGPAVFRPYLPKEYWENFCKLVYAVQIVQQRSITLEEILDADRVITEWQVEFEKLYYRRDIRRLHYVRPCVHAIGHVPMGTYQMGPRNITSQWSTENTIGNLVREIRLHANPFANLAEIGVRRARLGALKALIPELVPKKSLPQGAVQLSGGYTLLPALDKELHPLSTAEKNALKQYLTFFGQPLQPGTYIRRWATLRLPTRQRARSLWQESQYHRESIRASCNVKVRF